jgi:hypothetical protein
MITRANERLFFFATVMRPFAVRALATLSAALICGASQKALAQDADEWTPQKFLETVKYIADNVDLEDEATVARLLRIEFQSRERPSPGKDLVLKSQQVDYLSDGSFRVSRPIEEENGRKRAYIGITLKPEKLCIQLEDAHAVLGEKYYLPRPAIVDYWTPNGEIDHEAIANELNARDGRFYSIAYRPSTLYNQGTSITFYYRRCAQKLAMARQFLPASK